ncbi:MAG: ATP-dependent Clp protease ATP-binding subunit ClpX [Zoogloeaceae bacterium]|jgi:ATP-dependent Clp protease ATP-binding subunit ClpX|nr:ATP-dependent Clp protease ATP-binding subunit ClpX [Zoogloeaceae bacterium]
MTDPHSPLNPAHVKPSDIVRYLNQYVIGQEEAKRVLAVAVYTHYRKLALAEADPTGMVTMDKSNVLIVGPSGCGKTLLCETLSRQLEVPFVTADATSLAQTQYVGEEIEAIMARLLERAGGDLKRASQGIVFIDEIDKLKASDAGTSHVVSGESVQHALLKIMEGYPVRLSDGLVMDTGGILFICGGAFVGLERIMARTHSFGFISTTQGDDENILERLNSRVKPTDLFEYGLIPEFTGRLPVVVRVQPLTKEMLARIMVEPKNALYRQFQAILAQEGVQLGIAPAVFLQIAEIAQEYKTGARSLRGIFEELLNPVLFAVPDQPRIKQVLIRSLFEPPQFLETPLRSPSQTSSAQAAE